MRSILAVTSLFAALTVTPGCSFYFGDDDDDCQWGGEAPSDPIADPGIRNPETGLCEYYGGGGGGCDPACGPCADDSYGDRAPLPSWGYCESYCTGLDELTCQATSGCRAAYLETCGTADAPDAPCDLATQRIFFECWAVDQSGPIQGSCENLDSWTCSMHDDCVAVHADTCNSAESPLIDPAGCLGNFLSCQPEVVDDGGCYTDADCALDQYCNAAEVCLPPPECQTQPDSNGISECGICYGWCVSGEPPPPPPPPPIACEQLITEAECVARDDCTPIYEGVNCTCDPNTNTCTCEDWLFTSCSSLMDPTDPP